MRPETIRRVRVDSPKYGTQIIRTLGPDTTTASLFRLEPVGRVSVRVVADADKPVAGLRIQAETFPEGYDLGGTIGQAEGHDRCERPARDSGDRRRPAGARARPAISPDLPYRGLPPANQVVEAGADHDASKSA